MQHQGEATYDVMQSLKAGASLYSHEGSGKVAIFGGFVEGSIDNILMTLSMIFGYLFAH